MGSPRPCPSSRRAAPCPSPGLAGTPRPRGPAPIPTVRRAPVPRRPRIAVPCGRLRIAACTLPRARGAGTTIPAALVVYRIGADGRLTFARKYDVDTGRFMQFWTGIVTLP